MPVGSVGTRSSPTLLLHVRQLAPPRALPGVTGTPEVACSALYPVLRPWAGRSERRLFRERESTSASSVPRLRTDHRAHRVAEAVSEGVPRVARPGLDPERRPGGERGIGAARDVGVEVFAQDSVAGARDASRARGSVALVGLHRAEVSSMEGQEIRADGAVEEQAGLLCEQLARAQGAT